MEQILVWVLIISFSILGVLFIVLIIAQLWYAKKDREELKPLAASLGGEYVTTKTGSYISLPNFDPNARLELDDGGDDFPSYLLLSMPVALDFNLDIAEHGRAEKVPSSDGRLEKNLRGKGVKADFSAEDPAFEQKYQALSSNVDQAKKFLLSGSKRETLDSFFNDGFKWLRIEDGFIFLQKPHYTASDLAPDKIRYYMEQLKKL